MKFLFSACPPCLYSPRGSHYTEPTLKEQGVGSTSLMTVCASVIWNSSAQEVSSLLHLFIYSVIYLYYCRHWVVTLRCCSLSNSIVFCCSIYSCFSHWEFFPLGALSIVSCCPLTYFLFLSPFFLILEDYPDSVQISTTSSKSPGSFYEKAILICFIWQPNALIAP